MTQYPCHCCEKLIFDSPPDGDFSICPICGWEDDPVQSSDPDFAGGANQLSLNQARAAWKLRLKMVGTKSKTHP